MGRQDIVLVPAELVQRWEVAYRRYGDAVQFAAVSPSMDRGAAHAMVLASHEVASVWRAMETTRGLPWWTVAALAAAAQAFEFQAVDWGMRAEVWPLREPGFASPQVRPMRKPTPFPMRRLDLDPDQ